MIPPGVGVTGGSVCAMRLTRPNIIFPESPTEKHACLSCRSVGVNRQKMTELRAAWMLATMVSIETLGLPVLPFSGEKNTRTPASPVDTVFDHPTCLVVFVFVGLVLRSSKRSKYSRASSGDSKVWTRFACDVSPSVV